MRAILRFLLPYRKGIILSTLAVTIASVCDLLLPTIMSEILDHGVREEDFTYIVWCCMLMLLVSGISLACTLIGIRKSSHVVASFCADVRSAVVAKVHTMSFEEFGQLGTAALVTRATHDVQTVSWVASELCGSLITIPVLFFGGVILSMRKDWMLSLILLLFVPLIFVVVILIGRKILPLWDKSDAYIDKQNDLMRQRLRGIRVIRAFGAESQEHEKIADATHTMARYIIEGNVAMGLITPLASLLLNISAVLMVYFGGWRMETGSDLSGGDVFAIVQYVSLVASGVIMAAFTIITLPHAQVAAQRIGQVLQSKGQADLVAPHPLQLSGEIVLEHLSFRYEGADAHALQDISLTIRPGQTVAVIGGTGSGKSTLVSMLMGFRKPTEGRILFDGVDGATLSSHSIRNQISCVLQNTTIYSGTIEENLKMGDPDASREAMLQALADAQGLDFVLGFTEGLQHPIRQSGKNLSGGQKQRLAIARALLKLAPIYIFDDSFSALDFLTEAKLRQALQTRLQGKTRIVITQRITSAMHCDCIFVMDQGALVDSGTHEQLLSRCEVYRQIFDSQTGGDDCED